MICSTRGRLPSEWRAAHEKDLPLCAWSLQGSRRMASLRHRRSPKAASPQTSPTTPLPIPA
eukprot:9255436-Karenia_brevis.AAC.1